MCPSSLLTLYSGNMPSLVLSLQSLSTFFFFQLFFPFILPDGFYRLFIGSKSSVYIGVALNLCIILGRLDTFVMINPSILTILYFYIYLRFIFGLCKFLQASNVGSYIYCYVYFYRFCIFIASLNWECFQYLFWILVVQKSYQRLDVYFVTCPLPENFIRF